METVLGFRTNYPEQTGMVNPISLSTMLLWLSLESEGSGGTFSEPSVSMCLSAQCPVPQLPVPPGVHLGFCIHRNAALTSYHNKLF